MRSLEGFGDFQKINDYMYIGNQMSAMVKRRLKEERITHVLKVNGVEQRFPADRLYKVVYKIVSLEDNEHYEITDADL